MQNEFFKLQITLYQRLANMIASGDDGGVEAVGKAFDLYRSCMDAATIENLGVTPLLNVIRDSLGTSIHCESVQNRVICMHITRI